MALFYYSTFSHDTKGILLAKLEKSGIILLPAFSSATFNLEVRSHGAFYHKHPM